MTRQVTLLANEAPIPLDYFVAGFIDHTVGGMVAALKGTGEIDTLDVTVDGGDVSVVLNGSAVPVNQFAGKIIRSTVIGMTSSLKGVDSPGKIQIAIRR